MQKLDCEVLEYPRVRGHDVVGYHLALFYACDACVRGKTHSSLECTLHGHSNDPHAIEHGAPSVGAILCGDPVAFHGRCSTRAAIPGHDGMNM